MNNRYEIITWTPEQSPPDWTCLPDSWQQRIRRHHNPVQQTQAAFAYTLLATLVDTRPLPTLDATPSGKIYFPAQPNLYISISHTKGGAMAAVATVPVGVDLECVRPVSHRLMTGIAQTNDPAKFFKAWVGNEAVAKCLGTGLDAHGGIVGDASAIAPQWVDAPSGYEAALAFDASTTSIV